MIFLYNGAFGCAFGGRSKDSWPSTISLDVSNRKVYDKAMW